MSATSTLPMRASEQLIEHGLTLIAKAAVEGPEAAERARQSMSRWRRTSPAHEAADFSGTHEAAGAGHHDRGAAAEQREPSAPGTERETGRLGGKGGRDATFERDLGSDESGAGPKRGSMSPAEGLGSVPPAGAAGRWLRGRRRTPWTRPGRPA